MVFFCEISISNQIFILTVYLERFKYIGNLFINDEKLTSMFNYASDIIEKYINKSQKHIKELQMGIKNFFDGFKAVKIKYDHGEIRLYMLPEYYRKLSSYLLLEFRRTEMVFNSNRPHGNSILSALCSDLNRLQDKRCFLKIDDFLVDFKLLHIEYDGFLCQKVIRSILLRLKKDRDFYFKLLCKKNEYQKIIDKITQRSIQH